MARLKELDYVVIDLETTGLYPERGDRIIEIGAVRMHGTQVLTEETFQVLVNPGLQMSAESVAVHGITNEELHDKKPIAEEIGPFEEFIAGRIPIAQNARFDMGFLRQVENEVNRYRICAPFLDTMLVSKNILFSYISGHSLDAIAKRLNVESKWARHRSLGDCLLTASIWSTMIQHLEILGKTQLRDVENCFVSLAKVEQRPIGEELKLF
jgi:DNA polymerase III epsilon subunit family exonuclease